MTLPTLEKTWLLSVNNAVTASSTYTNDFKALFLDVKNTLLTLGGASAWTVVGSSNSSVAGLDGVDRLTNYASIVNATGGSARSWIVLQQSALSSKFQVLFDFSVYDVYDVYVKVSPAAGFVGGSTTAAPTASDSYTINDTGIFRWITHYDRYNPVMFNVWHSTDGTMTRIGLVHAGHVMGLLMFEKPRDVITQWTDPSICIMAQEYYAASNAHNCWYWYLTNYSYFYGRISNRTANFTMVQHSSGDTTTSAQGLQAYQRGYNTIINEFEVFPLGLYCTTDAIRGRHGNLCDVWTTHATIPDCSTFPRDDSRQFVKWGPFVLPWNGVDRVRTF